MKETELQDELASIRSIMERSSKFISLSGMSGVLAGIYALIGAGVAYLLIRDAPAGEYLYIRGQRVHMDAAPYFNSYLVDYSRLVWKLLVIALIVLLGSITTALILSSRQARRKNQPMWGAVSRQLMFHMAVPLLAGGVFIAVMLLFTVGSRAHLYYGLVAPVSLIFYGISLVSAGQFTFADVKYLGLCEIALGLIAACLPGHGLLFWAFGFGVLHIIYGARIYFKYDR
jgi:hypothetical protein